MKTNPRHGTSGFTLIELMAVITIIVILAGLVVGGLGFVNERQAKEKAKVQIALLSKAIEEYKLDFGQYPATPLSTGATGLGGSAILFKALYWDSDNDGQGAPVGNAPGDADQKIYLADLDPATSKQGWTTGTASATMTIKDPWNVEYRYRSAMTNATVPAPNTNTINPDFDLWSSGKDGQTAASPTDSRTRDDIKNF